MTPVLKSLSSRKLHRPENAKTLQKRVRPVLIGLKCSGKMITKSNEERAKLPHTPSKEGNRKRAMIKCPSNRGIQFE
jgi:hypothetical protein